MPLHAQLDAEAEAKARALEADHPGRLYIEAASDKQGLEVSGVVLVPAADGGARSSGEDSADGMVGAASGSTERAPSGAAAKPAQQLM